MRVGQGFDTHRFGAGDHIIVGGIRIPYEQGIVAHSDGDVLLHAITDALLGAAGAGDIGQHFPDTDPAYKGADSRLLLRQALVVVQSMGWQVINVDATVIAQRPRLSPYVDAMCSAIAEDLAIQPTQVNIKASTTEHLGFVGRGEGISALAVILLGARDA